MTDELYGRSPAAGAIEALARQSEAAGRHVAFDHPMTDDVQVSEGLWRVIPSVNGEKWWVLYTGYDNPQIARTSFGPFDDKEAALQAAAKVRAQEGRK